MHGSTNKEKTRATSEKSGSLLNDRLKSWEAISICVQKIDSERRSNAVGGFRQAWLSSIAHP
jgi:hypothetical protein